MRQTLVEAPRDVLDLIVDEAVLPCLVKLQRDLGVALALTISQGSKPSETVRAVAAPSPPADTAVVGRGQVNVRRNYGGDRYIFRVEVIFPQSLSPTNGFSGFSVPGSVTVSENGLQLDWRTWAVQYNVWEFKNWV